MSKILLGRGMLGWPRGERMGDRYGVVNLIIDENRERHVDFEHEVECDLVLEQWGQLIAVVIESRKSTHIGDFAHGFAPPDVPPAPGSEILLGEGELFLDRTSGTPCVGLEPKHARERFWLNPRELYRAHDQTVDLFFVPMSPSEDRDRYGRTFPMQGAANDEQHPV